MAKKSDEIRFGRQVDRDTHLAVRRDADGNEREVVVRKPKDGTPVGPRTEILSVSPKCHDGWHAVQTIYGPPQVATPAYREGYDRIFGKKPDVGVA